MSNQLKDIVEDGFARLESLANKRKSILLRAEEQAEKTSLKQLEQAEGQMSELESQIISEMGRQSQKLQEELNASLEAILNREKKFVRNSINSMTARMAAALAEMKQTQANLEHNALDRLASCFAELNVESNFSREILDAEVKRFFLELNALSLENKASVRAAESDARHTIANEFDKSSLEIERLSSKLAREIKVKSLEANELIQETNKQQNLKWDASKEKYSKVLTQLLKKEFEQIEELIAEERQATKKVQEKLLHNSSQRVLQSAKNMNDQVQGEFELNYKAVSEKLTELKNLSKRELEEQRDSLLELDGETKRQVYRIYFDLIAISDKPQHERSNLEKSLVELSTELTLLAEDLRIRWAEIRKLQEEQKKVDQQIYSKVAC